MSKEVSSLIENYPVWIDSDLTIEDLEAIRQGGCASGAYMPAVTYHEARKTMGFHGDEVLELIEEAYGEIPPPERGVSWSGLCCQYLSMAVELWAGRVLDEVEND